MLDPSFLPQLERTLPLLLTHPKFLAIPPWDRTRCQDELLRRLREHAPRLLSQGAEASLPPNTFLPALVEDLQNEVHRDPFQRCLGIANRFAHRYCVDPADIAADGYLVFLKQFSRDPDGFPTADHIDRYLNAVCHNIARNLRRAAQRRPALPLDEARLEDDSYLAAHALKDEIEEQWARVYGECTPEQCRVLDLLRQGLSCAQVAASLEVEVNAVHKTMERIRGRIRGRDPSGN